MPGLGLRVEALGVAGAPAPNRLTTTFRFAGGVLLDTGAAAHAIPVREHAGTGTILLSHSHLDHTLGIPFVLPHREMRIRGLGPTLDAVRESLLDGRIWPDLSARAIWEPLEIGDTFRAGPWEVEVGPATHTVPCASYHFRSDGANLCIVGDTRWDEHVAGWVAERAPDACVVEVSYPDRLADLARRYGHQTPSDLAAWRAALGPSCRIHVTHMKPVHEDELRAECEHLSDPALHILRDGDVIVPPPSV